MMLLNMGNTTVFKGLVWVFVSKLFILIRLTSPAIVIIVYDVLQRN